ncbi:MAG: hypothetical protein WEG56_08990 [Chloroflexota bacterium]
MTEQRKAPATFPLRFANQGTRDLLHLVANRQGLSMNRLVQTMVERELEVMALGLEISLTQTVELLRSYRGEGRAEAWAAFAEAEALPEPLRAQRVAADSDPFGVGRAFAAKA